MNAVSQQAADEFRVALESSVRVSANDDGLSGIRQLPLHRLVELELAAELANIDEGWD